MKLDIGMLTHELKSLPDYARKVEAIGYDCLWSAETKHDPYLPLAVAATVTSTIKLGTSIAVAFPRSPMITAHIAWDLQKASDGRFILGLGSQVKGHNERRFSVKYESPAAKMREIVLALRAIWDCWQNGTKLNFKGQFYRFDLMTPVLQPRPHRAPADPRLHRGGERVHVPGGRRGMRRPARPSVQQPQVPPRVRAPVGGGGLRTSGRSRKDFTYVTSSFVVVGDTESELAAARQAVKQQIAFYASTRTYEPVLAAHGWQDLTAHLHRKSVEGDWKGMADLITDEMVDTYAVTGTYDDIGRKLKERYAGLLDRTALYQPYQPGIDDPRLPRLVKEFNLS